MTLTKLFFDQVKIPTGATAEPSDTPTADVEPSFNSLMNKIFDVLNGLKHGSSIDFVTDQIFKLTQENPSLVKEYNFQNNHNSIRNEIVKPYVQNEILNFDPSVYDPHEVLKYGELQPKFGQKIKYLIDESYKQGLKVMIHEGFRSIEEQNALSSGATKARGGQSFHNYGLAVDIVFIDKNGNASWDDKHDWKKLGEIGKKLDLIWGGDFKNFYDAGHFEYHPDLSIHDVQNINDNQLGLQSVWIKI